MLFLTEPSEKYKESYIQNIEEIQAEGRRIDLNLKTLRQDFSSYVQSLLGQIDPAKLQPGMVPFRQFWLVDEGVYIGRLNLRHELNEQLLRMGGHIGYDIRPGRRRQGYGTEILRLGLEKAKALGLQRVLLTCNQDNIASKKIIEHNGGKLENIIELEGHPVKVLRYWIDL